MLLFFATIILSHGSLVSINRSRFFLCRAVKSHFAYSSQSRYNSEFQGLLAVCTTALRLRKIFTGWFFGCSGRGKFFPVATISRSALQVRGKIRTQLFNFLCEFENRLLYLRGKLQLFPANYAQLISGRSRLHQLWLCTFS